MKIRRSDREAQEIKLDMTAMIDVVFQLLIFFVMTFKTPIYEGDFNIKMPAASDVEPIEELSLSNPLIVRLQADENNDLRTMTILFNADTLPYEYDASNPNGIFKALNEYVIGIVGGNNDPSDEDIEAEFEIDDNLKYDYTVKAIEAVSGYKQGDQVVQLIEKINFKDASQ